MLIDYKTMLKKAERAYEDFKEKMFEVTGSKFDPKSEPICKNIFVNGYMKALDDLVKQSQQN